MRAPAIPWSDALEERLARALQIDARKPGRKKRISSVLDLKPAAITYWKDHGVPRVRLLDVARDTGKPLEWIAYGRGPDRSIGMGLTYKTLYEEGAAGGVKESAPAYTPPRDRRKEDRHPKLAEAIKKLNDLHAVGGEREIETLIVLLDAYLQTKKAERKPRRRVVSS